MSVSEIRLAGGAGRRGRASRRWRWLAVALASLAVLPNVAAAQPMAAAGHAGLGKAPPEWARNAGSWPSHNYDLANTRATTRTSINSRNVSNLKAKWRLPLPATPTFVGVYSSNPIVVDGTIYLIDLHSRVIAVDQHSGQIKWERAFDSSSVGPNGLAYGWGMLYGTTFHGVFALDPRTGETIWSKDLVTPGFSGIDIAPQLYDNKVLISSVPSTFKQYEPGAMGMVWAFDARTGALEWEFNTVKDGDLWGHPEINSGGGLWFPPAVDKKGRVFLAVANPAPFPGSAEFPNGSSRPGPNLYTNSLVALDGRTGRVLWYQQTVPHDIRDYDLQDSPIVTEVRIGGIKTEIVIVAGKMGKVYAYRADDGAPLWTLSVGKHQNDVGDLPPEPVMVFPGIFGGVETPMALADGRLFVPWVDAGSELSGDEPLSKFPDLTQGRGGILATEAATGRVIWQRELPQMNFGAATVANDVVFTSTYTGSIYAFDSRTGRTLWTDTARAGINSFPAIAGDTLFVVAGATAFFDQPVYELIAYSLS